MKHMRMMWGCVAVILVIVVVAISGVELPSWARLAVLAACPVMMITMMLMMTRGSGQDQPTKTESADTGVHPSPR